MNPDFLLLLYVVPILTLAKTMIFADVAPPGPPLVVLTLGALLVLGFIVLVLVVISIVVIRMIKKKHTTSDEG